jgi:uncharacterized membrane protein YdjX (TVP38/TMEM64 family)
MLRLLIKLAKNPRLWIALSLVIFILICCFTPLRVLFDQAFLIMHLEDLGDRAIALFIIIYIACTALGVPGTVLTVAGGAVFGLIWGTVWSVIGATLGAIAAFWVARFLLREWAQRRFCQHRILTHFNQTVRHKPLNCVLAVRFANIIPFNLANFLFGLTPVGIKDYTIGTFVGIIPGTLAYTWLGVSGEQALHRGNWLPFALALGLLTLMSVLPILVKRQS